MLCIEKLAKPPKALSLTEREPAVAQAVRDYADRTIRPPICSWKCAAAFDNLRSAQAILGERRAGFFPRRYASRDSIRATRVVRDAPEILH